jgi:2-oxo-4-hydroxy-4-carboxy-5-ureidoimidazoline decarboxylase
MTRPLTREEFVARFGAIYEHSPWVAERAWDAGTSGADLATLRNAMHAIVDAASEAEKLALLRAHPRLAAPAHRTQPLGAHSAGEQRGAGLNGCTGEEADELKRLNEAYATRFGFPFIIAVAGLDPGGILGEFRRRIVETPETEFATALAQVHKIAAVRLAKLG